MRLPHRDFGSPVKLNGDDLLAVLQNALPHDRLLITAALADGDISVSRFPHDKACAYTGVKRSEYKDFINIFRHRSFFDHLKARAIDRLIFALRHLRRPTSVATE